MLNTMIILISLIGVLATVNYLGVTTGTRVSNFFTLTKLVIFACFVGGGLAALVFHPWCPSTDISARTCCIRPV